MWYGESGNGFVEQDGVVHAFDGEWSPGKVSPARNYVSLETLVELGPQDHAQRAAIASTITGALVPLTGLDPAWPCSPDEWVDPTHLLIGCSTGQGPREMFQADAATGTAVPVAWPETSPADAAAVRKDFWIGPDIGAGPFTANQDERDAYGAAGPGAVGASEDGTARRIALTNAGGLPLVSATLGGVVDHTLYVEGRVSSAAGPPTTTTLVTCDLRTGTETVLLPESSGGSEAPWVPGEPLLVAAIRSWVVAP